MKLAVVIDTNVPVVANEKAHQAGPKCVLACIDALEDARENKLVLIDDGLRVLEEYRQNLSMSGQPGVGDLFFKWLWVNQSNGDCCRRVPITPINGTSGEDYEEFPRDPALRHFDHSDRKFVAVAIASGLNPRVLNASDTDWWIARKALESYVSVVHLCPELMRNRSAK